MAGRVVPVVEHDQVLQVTVFVMFAAVFVVMFVVIFVTRKLIRVGIAFRFRFTSNLDPISML
jgi:hypothetical protein